MKEAPSPHPPSVKKVSLALFFIELVLLGVPVTLFALFGLQVMLGAYLRGGANSPDLAPSLIAMVPCFLGLLGFWGLSYRFLSGGGRAVRQSPAWLLAPAAIGICMTGLLFAMPSDSHYKAFGLIGAFGLPLLIPTLHMAVESLLARTG